MLVNQNTKEKSMRIAKQFTPTEKEQSIANELLYKVRAHNELQSLVSKLKNLVKHSASTKFPCDYSNVVIGGGALVDLYLGRDIKDYDVFINIDREMMYNAIRYLQNNESKISLIPTAASYLKDNKLDRIKMSESHQFAVLLWISGLIANRFFGKDTTIVTPSRDKLYDMDGVMAENYIEGISKPIQLCFNVNRNEPLNTFDLDCCKIGLKLDGNIFGDGMKSHFVQFNNPPTTKVTERAVKYICKGVPPNARQIYAILDQYGTRDNITTPRFSSPLLEDNRTFSGAAIALMEWISGKQDVTLYERSIPTEIVKYKTFKKQLDQIPLTAAIVNFRKGAMSDSTNIEF